MEKWIGKVAVVTGASVGIGKAIAKRLVQEGMQVVGIARRVELVEESANELTEEAGKLFPLKCNVASEDDVKEAFQWILENVGPVALLVNNAAIVKNSTFVDLDPKDLKEVIDINFHGVALCTQQAIHQMKDAGIDGQIIGINSIAGHKILHIDGSLNMNVYPCTKYALTVYLEYMRQELRNQGSKIKITSLSPGFVDTDILKAGNMGALADPEVFRQMVPHLQPEDIADSVVYILGTKPNIQIHELTIRPLGEMV